MDESQNQFGMTEQDVNSTRRSEVFLKIKTIFASIAPAVIKVISVFIYYLIRFLKAFITASMRMVMGKEV